MKDVFHEYSRTYRDEVPIWYPLRKLTEVRELANHWIHGYNEERPHDFLEDLTLVAYLNKYQQLEHSNCN